MKNNVGAIYPYREFCSVYDFLVGCFLIYYTLRLKKESKS